ncbi:MAG: hypothetical protein GX575_12465 [Candidatus Anammoximicrobium sp.]|nr:hypothetical protein [Candidatus Anammoximicrobium sp.]
MDTHKVRNTLQAMIAHCGQTIRDCELRAVHRPDQPPIDVEWFRVMRAKARGCLQALDAGDMDEFRAMAGHIAEARDQPLWPSMARAPGLRPSDDWLAGELDPQPTPSGSERQTLVHCDELAKGWVYVHAETSAPDPTRLSHMLNDALCRWLTRNPSAIVRAVLPIVAGGNMVRCMCGLTEPALDPSLGCRGRQPTAFGCDTQPRV